MSNEENTNKGNSYSQHGNHGIGNMSGGEIGGNATVAGKINATVARKIKIVNNNIKQPVRIAIASLTAIVGVVGITFAGKYRSESDNINIGGDINAPTTFGKNSPLTIYEGDPPEVRQHKLEQAKKLIAEEVLTNINNMDARLSYLADVLEDDNFDQRLQEVRNKVAPSLSEIFDSGYRQLTRQQEVSSLRGAFTSRPLYGIREPLIQVFVDGNANPGKVRVFYNNLTEVQDASESLFRELSSAAQETSTNPKIIAHQEKSVKLAIETLINRSQTAHIYDLSVLDSLEIPLPNAQERLSYLEHLKPNHLVSPDQANQLLAKQIQEIQRLITERVAIVEEADVILDNKLTEYEQLSEKLIVQPSDTWNKVVLKQLLFVSLVALLKLLLPFLAIVICLPRKIQLPSNILEQLNSLRCSLTISKLKAEFIFTKSLKAELQTK